MLTDPIGDLHSLRIKNVSESHAWVIRDSCLPWRARSSCLQKKLLLSRLFAQLPIRMVWLDSRHEETALALTPRSDRLYESNGDWCGWFDLDLPTIERLVDSSLGGWACVFSVALPRNLQAIAPLPVNALGVTELLTIFGGDAIVVSEIDDEFWILASK